MKLITTCIFAIAIMLASPSAISAVAQPVSAEHSAYDLSKLKGICGYVYDRTRAPVGSGHRYVYERLMEEAAGVTVTDGAVADYNKKLSDLRD